MDQLSAHVGGSTVLIESSDGTVPGPRPGDDDFGTSETSSARDLRDAYTQLKQVLRDVADDLGATLASSEQGPTSVEVEFALAFAGEANAWVIKASGQGSIKATLKWDRSLAR